MTRRLSRRAFLGSGAVAAIAGAGYRVGQITSGSTEPGPPITPPRRQHAWNDSLELDEHGNHLLPPYHRLLHFAIDSTPATPDVEALERAMLDIERQAWTDSLQTLLVLGWGVRYFERFTSIDRPIEPAERMSSFETPDLDGHDACLHLAGFDETYLDLLVEATTQGSGELAPHVGRFPEVLGLAEVRTGFVGTGIPAQRQAVGGIPEGEPVPRTSPLYMGFRSGFRKNQATEDDITIESGPFVGGTTMHVSKIRLRLNSWYEVLDERQRVARMFSPATRPDEVEQLENEATTHVEELESTARTEGVIGHLQATAAARKGDKPLILRRDFNTNDAGNAGLHFVSLQRSVEDFVLTRRAMNAAAVTAGNAGIDARTNNGINEFIFVTNRANYLVPPRRLRSFPHLNS